MSILNKILPTSITNTFSGKKIALYIFIIITLITIVRSIIHIVAADGGAQSIAGFPIDTYSADASKLVVLIFSMWGLSQLLMALVYVAVLIKYKSLIPLMYVLIITEYVARLLIGLAKPAVSTHTVPGGVADYVIIPVAIIMLILSVWNDKKHI